MDNLNSGDSRIIFKGTFGATYHMVNFCKLNGFIPLYSVNKRIAKGVYREWYCKEVF